MPIRVTYGAANNPRPKLGPRPTKPESMGWDQAAYFLSFLVDFIAQGKLRARGLVHSLQGSPTGQWVTLPIKSMPNLPPASPVSSMCLNHMFRGKLSAWEL